MYPIISIDFTLSGDYFDPEVVTKKLGIQPIRTGIKGEKTPARGEFFWKKTLWMYNTGNREALETSPLFSEVIDLFEPKIPEIISLKKAFNLSVSVCMVISVVGTTTPIIFFDSRQIAFLHELNATLDFDEYWSPDEEDDNPF